MGVPPPPLAPDACGVTGFTVTCRSAQIGFAHDTRGDEPAVLMMALLGPAPEQAELPVLRALLSANFNALGVHAPSFMRDGAGQLWYSRVFALAHLQAQVEAAFGALQTAADVVEAWQAHHLLQVPEPAAHTPPFGAHFMNMA